MYWVDTEEKLNRLLDGIESGDIVIGGTNPTEQDFAEISSEINKYKAMSRKYDAVGLCQA